MHPLIEHHAVDKNDNTIVTGFFCCTYCDFKGLMCIDANSHYDAGGLTQRCGDFKFDYILKSQHPLI